MTPFVFSIAIIVLLSLWFQMVPKAHHRSRSFEVFLGVATSSVAFFSFLFFAERTVLNASVTILGIAWGLLSAVLTHQTAPPLMDAPLFGRARTIALHSLLALTLTLPIILINSAPAVPWNLFSAVGVSLVALGVIREVLFYFSHHAPMLAPFSAPPRGVIFWWGMALVAFSIPIYWIAVVSPAIALYRALRS